MDQLSTLRMAICDSVHRRALIKGRRLGVVSDDHFSSQPRTRAVYRSLGFWKWAGVERWDPWLLLSDDIS